jgi:hypothetical protein
MYKLMPRIVVFLALVGLAGCGSPPPADTTPFLATSEATLQELLTKPRAELAALDTDWVERARALDKSLREGGLQTGMLPELRFPLTIPVLRVAQFSPQYGISRPPYAREGSVDSELAVHLARHGDVEGALLLAKDASPELRSRIEAYRCAHNYPVEWTRLIGLMLHSAEVRLALGHREGALELIDLHKQLREVLDPKAAEGPLGAALLSRGHKALTLASFVYQKSSDETEMAQQIDAALAAWGPMPSPLGLLRLGGSREELSAVLGGPCQGRVAAAADLGRALDLLALPVPGDKVQAVEAFFNESGRLSDLLVTYSAGMEAEYAEPGQMAHRIAELETNGEGQIAGGIRRITYELSGTSCQFLLVPRTSVVGALVQFHAANLPEAKNIGPLARDFGEIHMDRSFEENRKRLAPEQKGDRIRCKRTATLAQMKPPLAPPQPVEADLERRPGQETVSRVTFRYSWESSGPPPLHQLALPFWQVGGPALMEGVDDDQGGAFTFSWQDAQTRHVLRLPYASDVPVEVLVEPAGATSATAPADTAAFDAKERKERIAKGQPISRLSRKLEGLDLGQPKDQALKALPQGQAYLKKEIPGGISVTFQGDPLQTDVTVVRHLVLRWNEAARVAEIRALYKPGPAVNGPGWGTALLADWKKKCGSPVEVASTWAKVWSDPPAATISPKRWTWHDDLTRLDVQGDGATCEAVLRDCPTDQPEGIALPPLEDLPRGPESCVLGTSKTDLLKAWKEDKPGGTAEVDLVLYPPKESPYDALLIWFEGDRVSRVVARHRRVGTDTFKPAQISQSLSDAWGSDLRSLGWPNRQDFGADRLLRSLFWNDERTRIRMYWQETDNAPPEAFTEWKNLPAQVKTASAKP